MMVCPKCNGTSFVKHGFVMGIQRWKCTSCGRNVTERTFSVTYRHRHTIDQIRAAVALMLLTNASTRNAKIICSLFMRGPLSHVTLWEWTRKFKNKLEIASKSFRKISAGRIWHIDEMFIKVRGSTSKKDCSYLVIVKDQHGTILAVEVHNRDAELIEKAIMKAKQNSKRKPLIIVSDKFKAYPKAVQEAFPKEKIRDNPKHVTAHFKFEKIQHRKKRYRLSNNCIERTNSFVREWMHGKRGFKSLETARQSLEVWSAVYNARHVGIDFWYVAFPSK